MSDIRLEGKMLKELETIYRRDIVHDCTDDAEVTAAIVSLRQDPAIKETLRNTRDFDMLRGQRATRRASFFPGAKRNKTRGRGRRATQSPITKITSSLCIPARLTKTKRALEC